MDLSKENFVSYFKTSYGGYWNDSEITLLNNPSTDQLKEVLDSIYFECKYTIFIAFTPIYSQEEDVFIEYNQEGNTVSLSILKENICNGIVILDDHSGKHKDSDYLPYKESIYAFMLNRFDCVTFLKEKNIKETPSQIILLYSLDSPKVDDVGSLFSYYLLNCARGMVKEKILTTDFFSSFSFIRIPLLFDLTKKCLEKNKVSTKKIGIEINATEEINEFNSLVFTMIC